jgi:cyclophilin family peptidyl-prolyl cis-trans isomerase
MSSRKPIVVGLVLAVVAGLSLLPVAEAGSVAPRPAGCRVVEPPRPHKRHRPRPPETVRRSDHLLAVVSTSCGKFWIRLDARRQPTIVNSFVYLAHTGFYRGLAFYRVVPDFVIQGGDPTNAGYGGPGYSVTEQPPKHFHYRLGTVAMAKTAEAPRGSSGSTFFVVGGREGLTLPNLYGIVGQVTAGMKTVKRIEALGTESETPRQPVRIASVMIRDLRATLGRGEGEVRRLEQVAEDARTA